eukprot:jgi/Ulvmu1/12307/UM088_0027.1
MSDDEDAGCETDFHTEYGSGAEINSDYFTDGDLVFDSDFDPEDVITSFEAGAEGSQPFEFFREQRRSARHVPPEADPAYDPNTDHAMEEIQEAADHVGKQAEDRRGAKRKLGHGRRARRRKPTRVSRGILPPQGDELMQKANTEIMLGNFSEALPHLMECIKRYPNFTEPWMSFAATFENMGHHDRALHCYAIALHMKPSDDNIAKLCAEMSMMYGYHKQAIWAWSKYIRMKRREYEPQQARLLLFMEHIGAQSNPKQARRICSLAIHAANSMLRTFPGDCFASLRLPEFHYKAGESAKAIVFLEEFAREHPGSFSAEHVNMLAELHMHRRSFSTALDALRDLYGLDRCRESPDLAAKVSICNAHCGNAKAAETWAAALWELLPEENSTGFVTYDRADLFLDVTKAMAESEIIAAAATMLEKFVEEHQVMIPEALDAEGDGSAPRQENRPEPQALQANLIEMLPFISSCSTATGELDLALTAYELANDVLEPEDPDYCNVMLSYVDVLLLTQTSHSKALAAEINTQVQEILSSDTATVRDIDTQVKVIENWHQAGNEVEVEKCVARLLDSQMQLEQEEQQAKTKALSDLPLDLQRRVVHLQRNPHLAARAKQSAARDAAAAAVEAPPDEFVPPNPELFWSATAANATPGTAAAAGTGSAPRATSASAGPPADPRAAAGTGLSGAAPPAPSAVEDEALILAPLRALAPSDRPVVKDRRQDRIRQLDAQAVKVMQERAEELAIAGAMHKTGGKRLKHLAEHPGLFPILIQVLEARLERGDSEWVARHTADLLRSLRKSTGSQQLRCNRTRLQLLSMRCRLDEGALSTLSQAEQKQLFSAWPHSLQAWNLFSRWCNQRGHLPVKLINRLHESFPDSLPLLLLRGHTSLMSGQIATALGTYFGAFKMVPENALVSLFIGVGYLAYATSRAPGDRHAAILKAFAFLSRYAARCGSPPEAAYNLGRAFHHLELAHLAAEWYNRSLALCGGHTVPGSPRAGAADDWGPADVSFECAHNLALIYEASGAVALAARLRATYCSV